ncbi:hypothetical protein HK097_002664, partial [Rhizophlyctis rosea]
MPAVAILRPRDTDASSRFRVKRRVRDMRDEIAKRQRAEAVMQLLDRKRQEYREEHKKELEEHAFEAREKVKRYERRAQAARAAEEDDRHAKMEMLKSLRHRNPTYPQTHQNQIPAHWKSSWYNEIVSQAHLRLHRHCPTAEHMRLSSGLRDSREVIFGRLLTPDVKMFRKKGGENDVVDHFGEDSGRKERRENVESRRSMRGGVVREKRRRVVKKGGVGFGRRVLQRANTQAFSVIPPLPTLSKPMGLSQTAEEQWDKTVDYDVQPTDQTRLTHQYKLLRMTEAAIRNKEAVTRLLSTKPTLL